MSSLLDIFWYSLDRQKVHTTYKSRLNKLNIFLANAEEGIDIEFTVTTLNCQHNDDHNSPERRTRFSSFKKSNALSKAVRSKLAKTMQAAAGGSGSAEKQKIIGDNNNSHENEKTEPSESCNNNESSKSSTPAQQLKVTKKRSKLCLLL